MARATHGTDLMNRLNAGELRQASSTQVEQVRAEVCQAIEELLDVGARIRPLYVRDQVRGWVRGLHLSERKQLERWVHDENTLLEQRLLLATSLSREEINALNAVEIRSLVRLVNSMSESDLSLYPYISAFTTTGLSEQMWCSHGTEITAYRKRLVEMPDGCVMRIQNAPDQARLWATLCTYREKAKTRLDGSMNALMIVRPWAGRAVDPLANELKVAAKRLVPDILDPWQEIVRADRSRDFSDGWAHGEDDSIEGMQRELAGMLSNDRHERIIERFEKQERERAEKRQQEIDKKIAARGGKGFVEQKTSFSTSVEVKKRQKALKVGRPGMAAEEFEVHQTPADRLSKYL